MGKKGRITLGLALVAVAVAGLLTFQVFGPGILPRSEGYERMDAGVAGAESLAGYGSLPDETGRLVGEAYAAVDQAHLDARAAIDARVAEVTATVGSTLAQTSLPEVPAGIDADTVLWVGDPEDYVLPGLPDGLAAPDLPVPVWQAPVLEEASSSVLPGLGLQALPRTGIGPIDEGLGQIEAVYQGLAGSEDPLGGLGGLGGLGDPLAGTPLAGQTGPADGVPDTPGPGAIDPDEEGALRAKGHATGFLGSAGTQYGTWTTEVQHWIDIQSGLLGELDGLQTEVESRLAETETLVDTELEARLAEIQSILDEEIARVETTIGELEDLLERISTEETAALQALAKEQAKAILATGEAQASVLLQHAEGIEADLQAQLDLLHAEGQDVLAGLAEYEAQTGVSMQTEAEAVTAAVRGAQESLVAQAEAQQAYLLGEARAVRDGATVLAGDVLAQTDGVFDGLASEVEGQVLALQEAGLYWSEAWTVWADASLQAEVALATEALSVYRQQADHLLEQSVGTAYGITEDGLALAASVMEVSRRVELDAMEDVGLDLDVIGSVRDDYSTVPTPDRQERAAYWTDVIDDVSGGVGSLLFVSSQVQELSERLYEVSGEVQGALEAA